MLVTVIQHLMAIIKSIYLVFCVFLNITLFRPPEQSLRSSKRGKKRRKKSTLRSNISPWKIGDLKV